MINLFPLNMLCTKKEGSKRLRLYETEREGDQPSRDETDYSAFMGELEEWIDRIIDGTEAGVSYEAQHITFTKAFHATLPRASLTC